MYYFIALYFCLWNIYIYILNSTQLNKPQRLDRHLMKDKIIHFFFIFWCCLWYWLNFRCVRHMFYIDFYKETYIFFTTLIIFLPADRLARADRLAPAHRLAPTKCIRRDKPIVNLKTMDKSDIRPALILSRYWK